MIADSRRRQKQLAKKAAKRKAKKEKSLDNMVGIQAFSSRNLPIHQCSVSEKLFETGIGQVLISRKRRDGCYPTSIFLLDVYCLGVKNAFFNVFNEFDYEDMKSQVESRDKQRFIHPSCVRKLVEGAVAYAKDLGFSPYKDYKKANQIFGDIDATSCPKTFTFGKDGKPFFISGPNDTPATNNHVIDVLTRHLGPDGFHFLTASPGDDMSQFFND